MQWQSASSADVQEAVFRTVISGITATDTTTPSIQEGEPVVLSTATAYGTLGQVVIRALTVTDITSNRLLVGVARGTISHQSLGLAQVYGVAPIRLAEAATVAAFDRLVPDLNTTATALAAYGRGAWIARTMTDTNIHFQSAAAVVAVAPATAVSGTAGPSTGYAFIRAL